MAGRPVIRSPESDELVSFLDLVEMDLIRQLKARGARTRNIAAFADEAARALGVSHPFLRKGVRVEVTDTGRVRVYLPIGATDDLFLELGKGGQYVLQDVVAHLQEVLEYDEDDVAGRWWPAGKGSVVVIDPRRGFGTPVVDGTRIPADTLHEMVLAEDGDVERVARMYRLPVPAVAQAVRFVEDRRVRFRRMAA